MKLHVDEALTKRLHTPGSRLIGTLEYAGNTSGVDCVSIAIASTVRCFFCRYYGGPTVRMKIGSPCLAQHADRQEQHDYRQQTVRVLERSSVVWRARAKARLWSMVNASRLSWSSLTSFTMARTFHPRSMPVAESVGIDGRTSRRTRLVGFVHSLETRSELREAPVRWKIVAEASHPALHKLSHRTSVPITVFPLSDPPPLLPSRTPFPQYAKLIADFDARSIAPARSWTSSTETTKLSRGLTLGTIGNVIATLYLPSNETLARSAPIPYLVTIEERSKREELPSVDWSKARLRLHRATRLLLQSKTDAQPRI